MLNLTGGAPRRPLRRGSASTESAVAERIDRYRAAGITTLLAKLDGDYDTQLSVLRRLVAQVGVAWPALWVRD